MQNNKLIMQYQLLDSSIINKNIKCCQLTYGMSNHLKETVIYLAKHKSINISQQDQQLKQLLNNSNFLMHQNSVLDQFNHRKRIGNLANTRHDEAIIIWIFKTICMKPNDDTYRYAVLLVIR